MTRGAELRQALREALTSRLEPEGWQPIRSRGSTGLAAYARKLDGDFAAVAEIACGGVVPDRHVILNLMLSGISYEPLRRLSPLLGERFTPWPPMQVDIHMLHEGDEPWLPHIDTDRQIPGSADRLAELVHTHSHENLATTWTLDRLLDGLTSGGLHRAALLAAAGRIDEAYAALDRDVRAPDERAAYQLRRWLDSGCDESLIPPEPQAPPELQSPRFRPMRRDSRDRDAAVRRVRDQATGQDRDALRTLLEQELAQCGVAARSPLWLERTLDDLQRSPAERTAARVDAVTSLVRLGLGAVRALRARELPDVTTPGWLQPPPPAFHEPPVDRERWVAVTLDLTARGWLKRAHTALPRLASLTAWLRLDGARVMVCIGDQTVGTIAVPDAALFTPAIEAATFRGEFVRVHARLTERPSDRAGYLLELNVPAG